MDFSHPLAITVSLMMACLVVCVVLFVGMKSTAFVNRPGYRLGGAVAAFFLLFPLSYVVFSKTSPSQTIPTPASIPSGYKAVVLQDAKLAMAVPARYNQLQQSSMLVYSDPNSSDALIINSGNNDSPGDCNNPENLNQMLRNIANSIPSAMPVIQFKSVEIAPLNGMNSAAALSTLELNGHLRELTFRIICDPMFDKYVTMVYPTSTESAVMVSTVSRKP